MTRIAAALSAPGLNGFYYDDQRAIQEGAEQEGLVYLGVPVTSGFQMIREPGQVLCVIVLTDEGWTAVGDCTWVQYPGVANREPLLRISRLQELYRELIAPVLIGKSLDSFRPLVTEIEEILWKGSQLPVALRYGVSQALLHAVALSKRQTMTEVLLDEYSLPLVLQPVPIYVQTGDDRYVNAEKAILKTADVLPHGCFNEVTSKVGRHGEMLLQYVKWLRQRIIDLRGEEYGPTIHLDLYGTPSRVFNGDLDRVGEYLVQLEKAVAPHKLQVEAPIYLDEREAHLEAFITLRRLLKRLGSGVKLVADEWCNTLEDIREFVRLGAADMVHIKTPDLGGVQNSVEAVLATKGTPVEAFLGGSSTDTDQSARVAVHVALAARPSQMLAKPGMGVDEGLMVVRNEMERTLAILRHRARPDSAKVI